MWMGIDVGTGGTRALLVDQQGRVRASHTAAHDDMTMLKPLWAEQRPENWWGGGADGDHRRAGAGRHHRECGTRHRLSARCTDW